MHESDHMPDASPGHTHAGDWDERYSNQDHPTWSGEPNGVLLAEIAGQALGRALDVGCGEGADAIWLALQGWRVTAIDISQNAIDRASIAATDVGATVEWLCADVTATSLPVDEYDLVSVQYPALPKVSGDGTIRSLLASIAAGGTLLFVGHDPSTHEYARSHGFEPNDYIQPSDVVALLDDGWIIEIHETRTRAEDVDADSPHKHDTVLRAKRRQ